MGNTANPIVVRADELDQPGEVIDPKDLDAGAPKAKKGAITRFKEGLRSSFGLKPEGGLSDDISQIGEGFKQMATHPLDSLSDLVGGAFQGQEDVAQKGITRMKSPGIINKITGGAQYLESGIPFAGPILSGAGERAEAGDYAGMAGEMAPLISGEPLEKGVRAARSGVASAVRAAPEVGGALAGYATVPEHPYIGAYIGRELGGKFSKPAGKLADLIGGEEKPAGRLSDRIGGEWVPEPEKGTSEATQTLRGNKTPFSAPGATSSATVKGEAQLPKPRLSAAMTKDYLESKGQSVGQEQQPSPKAPEKLSPFMQRKVGEAEGRYDASRMAATGAERGEDVRGHGVTPGPQGTSLAPKAHPVSPRAENLESPGFRAGTKLSDEMSGEGTGIERRATPRERDAADFHRNAVMDDLRKTAMDKTGKIPVDERARALRKLNDMIAHPSERAELTDIKAAKPEKLKTRAEAEASVKERAKGRGKRMAKPRLAEGMGND